jgi:hypothetical protein
MTLIVIAARLRKVAARILLGQNYNGGALYTRSVR